MSAHNDSNSEKGLGVSLVNFDVHSPQEVQVACYSRQQALDYIKKSNYGRALAHLFVALRLIPEWRNELRSTFSESLRGGCRQLAKEERLGETIPLMKNALLIYPDDALFFMDLGSLYFRLGDIQDSLHYYQKALQICPNLLPASRAIQAIYNKQVERWHFRMLNDTHRNEAYRQAIEYRVKEGYLSIIDVGTGTGLLSLFADEAGAEQIWACEFNPFMVKTAQSVLEANRASERINLINKHSNLISVPDDIPSRVSMLITEVFDAGLLGEGVLPMLVHAWENLLIPPPSRNPHQEKSQAVEGGVVIPHSATVWIAAIQCLHISRRYRLLPTACNCSATQENEIPSYDFDGFKICKICEGPCKPPPFNKGNLLFHIADKSIASNLCEPYTTEDLENIPFGFELLSEPYSVLEINFNSPKDLKLLSFEGLKKNIPLLINTTGSVDAIALWFHLNLDNNGTIITTAPFQEKDMHRGVCWHQAIFPSLLPRRVTPDNAVDLLISVENGAFWIADAESDSQEKPSPLLLVSEEVVMFLNNQTWVQTLQTAAVNLTERFCCCPSSSKKILDLNPFPVLGLEMLRRSGPLWKLYMKAKTEVDKDYVVRMARINLINEKQILFITDEKLEEMKDEDIFDVICLKVVEPSGELVENFADSIFLLDRLSADGIVVPWSFSIKGQLIESTRLIQESRVMRSTDQRDFNIAEIINRFTVDYHLDVSLSGLQCKKLSDKFEVLNFMLVDSKRSEINSEYTREILARSTGTGSATGIIYWMDIVLLPGIQPISTTCHDSHCNQAVIFTSFDVKTGQDIALKCLYWYGMFDLKVVSSNPESILFSGDN